MERISSRKNSYIAHLRALAADGEYRRERGEYLCAGLKTLREALACGAEVRSVLWSGSPETAEGLGGIGQYVAPPELFDYASPLKCSPGPLFTVAMPQREDGPIGSALVLENVQDPGNVGTVIRTANALGVDAVILVGDCADVYGFKAARATMSAIFRECVIKTELEGLKTLLTSNSLPLYGAALRDDARDIRRVSLDRAAVGVGSEGRGLSDAFLSACDGTVIIPMSPGSESLNAAAAAAIIMWQMRGGEL